MNALENAIRNALLAVYPELAEVALVDYRAQIVDGPSGRGAPVRVMLDPPRAARHGRGPPSGCSDNMLEASWLALADCIEYAVALAEAGSASAMTRVDAAQWPRCSWTRSRARVVARRDRLAQDQLDLLDRTTRAGDASDGARSSAVLRLRELLRLLQRIREASRPACQPDQGPADDQVGWVTTTRDRVDGLFGW